MKFTIEIETDNAAFHAESCDESDTCGQTGGTCEAHCALEIRRILNNVCQHLDDHDGTGGGRIRLRDYNGNTIGTAGWEGTQ